MTTINYTTANGPSSTSSFLATSPTSTGTPTDQQTIPQDEDTAKLLSTLEGLSKKKIDLLTMLQNIQKSVNDIEEQEKEIKAKLEKKKTSENQEQPSPSNVREIIQLPTRKNEALINPSTAEKTTEIAHSILIINTAKIIKSKDSDGEREHYSVSLISNKNEKVDIDKWPVDIKKHGEIKQITISDGKNETILDIENISIKRLIHYLSTDFDKFRKGINILDRNGDYTNKHQRFDCQRFSYYLKHGKEGTYAKDFGLIPDANYRGPHKHLPGYCYSIKALTAGFGRNGQYKQDDMSLHHFVCLAKDVYVSKYGSSDVLFTSYQHIIDAYFPAKFVIGNHNYEC